ncbi:phage portal protein [Pseudonocardia parietis]|uniref:HK97 family phage portal protein n=1 Tax=Pseudonocardia parietis TaxID=570936 RepID=A0ABS4W208_9PSEU|nr:phage portal protein [Pseudonocardia parietis]MBP2370232.1 HK97 family phage portal protein [Pseudonocardia parietis]
MSNWFTRLFRPGNPDEGKRAFTREDVWGHGVDLPPQVHAADIETALTLAPVYSATRLLADSVAALPLQAFRRTADGARKPMSAPEVFTDPTEFGTTHEWVQRVMTSLLLRGNAYGYVPLFDRDGYPRRIEWLHPDEVSVDDNFSVGRRPVWFWKGRRVDPGRLVHIPGYVLPGQVLGLAPISAFALTTETGLLSQQFGRDWFRNGSVPSGVLETDQSVDQNQARVLKDRFREATRGREPIVLGLGTRYNPITVSPDESQFLATLKMTVNQIASIYGIPPDMIGGEAGGSLTYANVEQQSLNFVTYTLRPWLTKLESSFSRLIPDGEYVRFNADAMVRADLTSRYAAHHIALTDGWKNRDEIRELEDLPPLPGGQGKTYGPVADPARKPTPVPRDDEDEPVRRLRAAGTEY